MNSLPLLEARGVSKAFPGLKALDDVSLSVGAGEVVALVGQNGSGKSTLVKVLAGIYQADPGSEVVLHSVGEDQKASLHFIHQNLGLVGSLSTIENLDLGSRMGLRALLPTAVRAEQKRAETLIAGFGCEFDVKRPIDELTAAERTIVAIARALDGWETSQNVLVLDEPTASLHGDEVEKLFLAVREVAQRGAGVVFISHRLDEVIELADRVVCLRDGKLVADVERGRYDHDDLVHLIAGEMVNAPTGSERTPGAPVLRAHGISATTIRSLDLELRAGEVLGVSGVLGSGRDQVAGILFGAKPGLLTSLEVGGRRLARPRPRDSIAAGLAYVPADRATHGVVMSMSVRENMTLPELRSLRGRFGSLDRRAEGRLVDEWMQRVTVRPPDADRPLELFSGGNQQKVVLAKWLRNDPQVLLMDEPTQGVDVGAKAGIFELIAEAAAAGAGVLVASSDAKELALICDRVLVMRDGVCVAELDRSELSDASLMRAGLASSGPVDNTSTNSSKEGRRYAERP